MIRTIAVPALAAGVIVAVTGAAIADGQDKIAFCHNENNLHLVETSVQAFFNAGHVDHEGDIWPAFDYTENGKDGEVIHVEAQGDQAVLANGCQPIVVTPSPTGSASPSPSDIPSSPPVSQSPSPSPSDTGNPSPSVTITPTPRETPEPPAPRYDEIGETVVDCENLTYTYTYYLFEFLPVFNEDSWEWVYPEEGTPSGPFVTVTDIYDEEECDNATPSPSGTITPTDSSTTSTAPVTPTVTAVPVAAELAHTGSDEWKIFVGTGLVMSLLGALGYYIGRRPSTTRSH